MAKFENSITHCLTECDHCTGAYSDDRNLILLNCQCKCHKNKSNMACEDIYEMIRVYPEILTENSGLPCQAKDGA
jgi:hypothetical protein